MANDIKINKAVVAKEGLEVYHKTSRTATPFMGGGAPTSLYLSLFDSVKEGLNDGNINPDTVTVGGLVGGLEVLTTAAPTVASSTLTVLLDATSNVIDAVLPAVVDGKRLTVSAINVDNTTKVSAASGDTVSGGAEYTFSSVGTIELVGSSNDWVVLTDSTV